MPMPPNLKILQEFLLFFFFCPLLCYTPTNMQQHCCIGTEDLYNRELIVVCNISILNVKLSVFIYMMKRYLIQCPYSTKSMFKRLWLLSISPCMTIILTKKEWVCLKIDILRLVHVDRLAAILEVDYNEISYNII